MKSSLGMILLDLHNNNNNNNNNNNKNVLTIIFFLGCSLLTIK